ncbi:MAG: S9 family peptidase [bacterium]|nr:S9 family peptidase [bacterium]
MRSRARFSLGQIFQNLSWAGVLCWCLLVPAAAGAETHPFDADDLVSMSRISDPRVSPDGERIAFVLRTTDLEANKGRTDLWLAALDGSPPRRLTTDPAGDNSPRFAPDSRSLYFLSSRSGSSQIWRLPLGGGEAEPVTDLPLDVANLALSPDGRHLAFSLEVFTDCEDLACTVKRLEEQESRLSSGRLYEHLFVRHWDTWKDGRRSHLFVLALDESGGVSGPPVDVTAGMDADVPSKPFGGPEEIAFAPDGQGIVFAARVAGAGEPWSTDFDLYHAGLEGGGAPRKLTGNPAWDTHPVFSPDGSPDGSTLAYLAMARPSFEADRFRIILRRWPGGEERVLAEDWDRSAGDMVFSPDGETLYVTAADTGAVRLFAIDVSSGQVREIAGDGHVRSPAVAGEMLVYGRDDLRSPVDLYARPAAGGEERRLTDVNRERLAAVNMGELEQFSFPGWNGEKVHGYLVKPVDFDPERKYPVAFLVHGGPQGSSDNDFHYRWNPQVYAGAGYAAIMIDFHGSTGYGQAFTDSIRDDWGGKPLQDLKKGLAAALERYPWLDGERACALGASYGGYMMNWIAGNWPDGFRCLVNHDGLFDLRSMYYSTEELWFPEWEMRGTPWQNPESFERHNPARFVENWRTPMLVVHGALDFRVVESQGFQTFTALQRRGIPSQLLYFPDENHWVLKPRNSLHWHQVVLDWLDRWTSTD